jgi:hypothetical protein
MTAEGASHIIRYLLSIVHASSFAAPSPTAQTRPIIRWLASMWRANVSNPSQTELVRFLDAAQRLVRSAWARQRICLLADVA